MANSNLKRFMRPEMKTEEVFDVKIKDKDGKEMSLKMKRLSQKATQELLEYYTKREPAYDKKGKPIIQNGRLVMTEERESTKYGRHLLVESLVEPDLSDPELMEFFEEVDKVEMLTKVFTPDEIGQISDLYQAISNYKDIEDVTKEDIEEAKNS